MNYTFEKKSSERYYIRSGEYSMWANIIISDDGFLDIQSDYGDYRYRWNFMGTDIKRFLISLDKGYLIKKLGMNLPKEFNADKTKKIILKDIIRNRRERKITKEETYDCWNWVKFSLDFYSEITYCQSIVESPLCECLYHDYESIPCVMEINFQLLLFLEKIWPMFKEILVKEISK